MKFLSFSQTKLGSSLSLPAHGWVGAMATLLFLTAHFAKQNTNSVGVQSEGEVEGGCGGNSASPEPKRSPAALLVQSRTNQKSFLFLLEEKIGGAQNKKLRRKLFCGTASEASGGGAERQNSAFGFSLKKVRISFSVRSQIVCCEFVASALRASAGRLYSICQDFLGSIATFCESKTRFAVAKQRINEVYEPILLFPPKAESKAIIFNSPKAIVQ